MAAPIGNQFWKLRSKHGRNKLFETPQLLLEAAYEYFEWCHEHPWVKTETNIGINKNYVKSIPTERPFTLSGLCLYCHASSTYWKEFRSNCKETSKDFLPVIETIEEIIYTQKFEGAAIGVFNANLIARELGLKEQTEHSGEIKTTRNLEQMSTAELIERFQAIKKIEDSESVK
jgi:hypothetical protein